MLVGSSMVTFVFLRGLAFGGDTGSSFIRSLSVGILANRADKRLVAASFLSALNCDLDESGSPAGCLWSSDFLSAENGSLTMKMGEKCL